MHVREVEKLNEQFRIRELHIFKKYKRLKKKFQKAIAIIATLQREVDRNQSHILIQDNQCGNSRVVIPEPAQRSRKDEQHQA